MLKTCLICVKIKLPGVCVMLFYLRKQLGCISSVQGQTVAVAKGWWKQTWVLSTVSVSVSCVDTQTLDSESFMQRFNPLSWRVSAD